MHERPDSKPTVAAGIDVGADWLDIARQLDGRALEHRRFANTAAGHAALCRWLADAGRRALFMPAQVAIRFVPEVGAFYERLVAGGKPKVRTVHGPVALVAAMRELLVVLNAMARDGERWDPDIVPGTP